MKYAWRSGNTTYVEKCHHEDTVIFDNGIKPHFVEVEATLGAYALWIDAQRCLVNAVLVPSEAYST